MPVSPSFGMTETCSQIATDGFALFGAELRIADDGELLVRGRSVAVGSLHADGWLHTGDLGALDGDGRLTIVGRKADTIVTGGENVAPAEVEAALLEHPAIADVGRARPPGPGVGRGRHRPGRARATGPRRRSRTNLRAHCADRLAPFKVPKRFELVAAVPRGVTGKLLRRELR